MIDTLLPEHIIYKLSTCDQHRKITITLPSHLKTQQVAVAFQIFRSISTVTEKSPAHCGAELISKLPATQTKFSCLMNSTDDWNLYQNCHNVVQETQYLG